jgi:hypothetical protein
MAEVILALEDPVADGDTATYHARVVGRLASDGMWEGWLEFTPLEKEDAEVLVGPVESRQPAHEHLVYWATGLTPVFLEGALQRAKRPLVVRTRILEFPASNAPAPRVVTTAARESRPAALLDPFDVGARSLDVLAQELRALNRPRLMNIIAAFDLNPAGEELSWMTDAQLARFIVVATEAQLAQRR